MTRRMEYVNAVLQRNGEVHELSCTFLYMVAWRCCMTRIWLCLLVTQSVTEWEGYRENFSVLSPTRGWYTIARSYKTCS